jgi:hypothetical protein
VTGARCARSVKPFTRASADVSELAGRRILAARLSGITRASVVTRIVARTALARRAVAHGAGTTRATSMLVRRRS